MLETENRPYKIRSYISCRPRASFPECKIDIFQLSLFSNDSLQKLDGPCGLNFTSNELMIIEMVRRYKNITCDLYRIKNTNSISSHLINNYSLISFKITWVS